MESDESQHFNERLNHWVASQGLWYQLRYSLAGNGLSGTKGFHLMGLGLRLVVLLVLAAGVGALVLFVQSRSGDFAEDLEERIGVRLHAAQTKIHGLARAGGMETIAHLSSTGGEGTFFSSLEARNIKYRAGLIDRIVGRSDVGTVTLARADVALHAGADSREAAQNISRALFGETGAGLANRFEIEDATLTWGYSANTRGSVENTQLRAQRTEQGWRVSCEGGTFSQNWLRRLEIVSLLADCSPEGIVFERAVFRKGQGQIEFTGLRLRAGEVPTVVGRAVLQRYPVDAALPAVARPFAEGSFSGELEVSGSIYSADGVAFEGGLTLEEGDLIRLKDRVHLLRALSVVDAFNNYRRVDFRRGSFRLKTGGGRLDLQEVKLDGLDLMTLEGSLTARPPTDAEREQSTATQTVSPLFETRVADEPDLSEREGDLTLGRAAKAAAAEAGGGTGDSDPVRFDLLGQPMPLARLQMPEQDPTRVLHYEGGFDITLPPDAFERAPTLRELFPGSGPAGRVHLSVPVQGGLHELTLGQAETIYRQGTR